MIPARDLVSAEALRRYDENGEPLYTRPERVLIALAHGECSASDLYDRLDASDVDERQLYSAALTRLVKQRRVLARDDRGLRMYRLAPVQPVKRETCGCTRYAKCETHAEINRTRTREAYRRKVEASGRTYRPWGREPWMCVECREPAEEGQSRCARHVEINRARARKTYERRRMQRAA